MKNLLFSISIFICVSSFGQDTNSKLWDVGEPKREKYSNSYYTNSNRNNSGLNDRSLANQVEINANCNDEGIIILEIKVNKKGIVTNVKFSPRGSNTTSKCLQEAAIKSAYKYKWNEDPKAPESQIGFLVFNFKNAE
jgi:hypothetical protein